MAQERINPQESSQQQNQDETAQQESMPAVQGQDAGVDSILDELDGLLETNASEFVAGYVQKGGQ